MTLNEWKWTIARVMSYGYRPPLLDIGGVLTTALRAYDPVRDYVPKGVHIWSTLDRHCDVTHQAQAFSGGPYGTIVSTSTLEHVRDLTGFFPAVGRLLKPDGLCFLSAPFRWMRHGDPKTDFWRFTADGLELLAQDAGLRVLEAGIEDIDTHRATAWIVCGHSERIRQELPVIDISQYLDLKG